MTQPFFDAVPASLEDAALMGGADIAATAIRCFLCAWNDFFFALIVTTRPEARTAPVVVVNFMNCEGRESGKIAGGGSPVMAPVLLFSMLVRRCLVSGLIAGAAKG